MANTIIPEKIKSSSTFANVDAKYGPYEASGGQTALQVADAQLSGGVVDLRTAGLTVGIKQSDGSIKEYWYQPNQSNVLELVEKGGGDGTSDYINLENKPSINGVALQGNKISAQLGLATTEQGAKADSAIQCISKGSIPLFPDENKVVDIPVDIVSAHATQVSYTQQPSATIDQFKVLQLEIPQGTPGHNPNLGTFDISDIIADPTSPTPTEDGDYIVVIDINAVSPRLPKEIYLWNGSQWIATGEAPTATFASGEVVSNVSIIKDFSGGVNDIANAEIVKTLKQSQDLVVNKYTVVEAEIDLTGYGSKSGYHYSRNNVDGSYVFQFTSNSSSIYYDPIPIPPTANYIKITFKSKTTSTGRKILFTGDVSYNNETHLPESADIFAYYTEGNYVTTSGVVTDITIIQPITEQMKYLCFSCINTSTDVHVYSQQYVLNENSIPVLQDVLGDKFGVKKVINSDNIYQTLYESNFRLDFDRVYKERLKCLIGGNFKTFTRLSSSELQSLPIKNLLFDGLNFMPILNSDRFGFDNTIYVSPSGTGTGIYETDPTNLIDAINKGNGSTIVLEPSVYKVKGVTISDISVKMKCIHGKAIFAMELDNFIYEDVTGSDNVKSAAYTKNIKKIFERIGEDYIMLEEVATLSECNEKPSTFYNDKINSTVYIHPNTDVANIIITHQTDGNKSLFNLSSTKDVDKDDVIFENIDFLGGMHTIQVFTNINLKMVRCRILGPHGRSYYVGEEEKSEGSNCLWVRSYNDKKCTSIAIECVCKYADYDGFNYHGNTGFVEINCVSGYHGFGEFSASNSQASTAHEDCVGFRVGGTYYNSNSSCVADVGDSTSVNSNCCTIQTLSNKGGFGVSTNAVMYLFGCSSLDTDKGANVYHAPESSDTAIIYSFLCDLEGIDDSTPLPLN